MEKKTFIKNIFDKIGNILRNNRDQNNKKVIETLQEEFVAYNDKEKVRQLLMPDILALCKSNEEKFYNSEFGMIVKIFNGKIGGSTLYKGSKANDIDLFFTNKSDYNNFLAFLETAPGKGRFSYHGELLPTYEYLEDKSIIKYNGKKVDVNLVSKFEAIEDILESKSKTSDHILDLFLNTFFIEKEEDYIDENIFNTETKSFGVKRKRKISEKKQKYRIKKDYKKRLAIYSFDGK